MSKAPTDAELGAALRVILTAMGASVTISPPAQPAKTEPAKQTSSAASATTEPASTAAEGPAAGNSQGYTPEAFSKVAIDITKSAAGGAKVGGPITKALLAGDFGTELLTAVDPARYDEFLAALQEKIDETHVPS